MRNWVHVQILIHIGLSHHVEDELDEAEEDLLDEMEVEQAAPVIPIPAPVEPPVKRKRGRPPKNKPARKCHKATLNGPLNQ